MDALNLSSYLILKADPQQRYATVIKTKQRNKPNKDNAGESGESFS